jgi:hypothetical protein
MEDRCYDADLTPFLRTCTAKDLQPLVEYVARSPTNTYGKATEYFIYANPQHRLIDDLVSEICRFGGNSMVNVFRGGGVPYAEIVRDVASNLKVTAEKEASVEEVERAILAKILDGFRAPRVNFVGLASGAPNFAHTGVRARGFLSYPRAIRPGTALVGLVGIAIEVTGPAYDVTIPCVCHIAYLRQQRKFGEMADA